MNRLLAALLFFLIITPTPTRADFVITGASWSQVNPTDQTLEFKTIFPFIPALPGLGFAQFSNYENTSNETVEFGNGYAINYWFTGTGGPAPSGIPTVDNPMLAKALVTFVTTLPATGTVGPGNPVTQPLTYGFISIATPEFEYLNANPETDPNQPYLHPDILFVDTLWSEQPTSSPTGGAILGTQGSSVGSLSITGALGDGTYFTSPLAGFEDLQGGTITVPLSNMSAPFTLTANSFLNNFLAADPTVITFNSPVPVPEPSSLMLLGLAAGGAALRWRRRSQAA